MELPAPLIIVDISQSESAPTAEGHPLTQTVTIDDAMPFRMLFSRDANAILMSLRVFLTLKIPISELVLALPVWGPSDDVMETHGSIVLPVALGADGDFQTFLINFLIDDPMLSYEAILSWGRAKPQWCHCR
jgi:hypothetical protein